MDDITAELRSWPARSDGSDGMSSHTVGGIMDKAANEIEHLRWLLKRIDDVMTWETTPLGRGFQDEVEAALRRQTA